MEKAVISITPYRHWHATMNQITAGILHCSCLPLQHFLGAFLIGLVLASLSSLSTTSQMNVNNKLHCWHVDNFLLRGQLTFISLSHFLSLPSPPFTPCPSSDTHFPIDVSPDVLKLSLWFVLRFPLIKNFHFEGGKIRCNRINDEGNSRSAACVILSFWLLIEKFGMDRKLLRVIRGNVTRFNLHKLG